MKNIHQKLIFFLACHFLPIPSLGLIWFDRDSNSRTPNYRIQSTSALNSFCFRVVYSDFTSLITTEFESQDVFETTSEYEVEDDREEEVSGHDFGDPATRVNFCQLCNSAKLLKYDSRFVIHYEILFEVLRC